MKYAWLALLSLVLGAGLTGLLIYGVWCGDSSNGRTCEVIQIVSGTLLWPALRIVGGGMNGLLFDALLNAAVLFSVSFYFVRRRNRVSARAESLSKPSRQD